jgi:hypothetical protein
LTRSSAPPPHGAEGDGILFSGVAADSRAAGTDPKKHEAFVFALLGLHADEPSAPTRFRERSAAAPWMDEGRETWSAVLRPFNHRGQVNWLDRASPGLALDVSPNVGDTPFVAITSMGWKTGPDLDMNRVRNVAFLKWRGLAVTRAARVSGR